MNEDEEHAWDQIEDEPMLWHGRFIEYLRMGKKRSVSAVFRKETKKNQEKPRTNAGPDWYDAEKVWHWKERATAYDGYIRAEEDRIIAEEKEQVLRSGFALMHKRVKELDRLARKLIRATSDESKVWLAETRTFRTGEDSTATIEKVQFNDGLFVVIDKYLGSIAAEMGERVKKSEVNATVGTTGNIGFYDAVRLPRKIPLKGGNSDGSNTSQTSGETS